MTYRSDCGVGDRLYESSGGKPPFTTRSLSNLNAAFAGGKAFKPRYDDLAGKSLRLGRGLAPLPLFQELI
jgi:hypothetical protein